ncbi:Dynein light chain Tctex-type 3 [Strongyloides ratti]|uniref:Dynein light chain Tctex-type 3 n=2 Tax=Strongyloides TaxID=6247 RepID=A0A090L7B9_STRRB|nr:Dynein light chain Tctex-type 3 [Strongyloides ratti]CEF65666.1 Dynein light chain Tctex-type 3 [Strongyloides ratti]
MLDKSQPPTQEEVSAVCKEALDTIIGKSTYDYNEANKWIKQIVETVRANLVTMDRPYKFIVSCVILQNNIGAGMNISSTCYWDKNSDQYYAFRWENKSILAACYVYAVVIPPN